MNDVGGIPPKIHDLVKLAGRLKTNFSDEQIRFLEQVNDFNIEARYPEHKFEFYKTCTKEFTDINYRKLKELYSWLKSQIKY